MVPEQARAEKQLTIAVDVYSLGAILYELLCGRPPFQAGTVIDTIMQVKEKEPDHPQLFQRHADRDLCAIALKCLQKVPGNRYESAAALVDDLERWMRSEPARARPPHLAGLAWRWLRRNALASAGVVALGIAAGLLSVLTPFALVGAKHNFLFPFGMSLLHPLRWFQLVGENSVCRYGTLAASAIMVVGIGWFVRTGDPSADTAARSRSRGQLWPHRRSGVVFGLRYDVRAQPSRHLSTACSSCN
jgi:hypothetical protein